MKTIISLLIAICIISTTAAQSQDQVMKLANTLIANKKYDSAFKTLEAFDPKNRNPQIALLKEDISLDYFISNIMYQTFAFKDLEKNEDISDYRGKSGAFSMYMFPVNEILDSLIKRFPANYQLYQ